MNLKTNQEELTAPLQEKMAKLGTILREMGSVLVAFSGGVDSTLLLYAAHKELGDRAAALVASSPTYPDFEIARAKEILRDWGVRWVEVHSNELEIPDFRGNSPRRCYYCKQELFQKCREEAEKLGLRHVADGANFDDRGDYRPGMEAARELGIRSPLMEAGFTKADIREISRRFGLPTWNKPSLACLASRFPYGTEISSPRLEQVAKAEEHLRSLGFGQLRVRYHGDLARIEIEPSAIERLLDTEMREKTVRGIKDAGFVYVTLDLQGYRTGAMNETLFLREKEASRKN
jgi:pyridinium-3,5-biscarboxylic acid mononucleotide sulfurtransferase